MLAALGSTLVKYQIAATATVPAYLPQVVVPAAEILNQLIAAVVIRFSRTGMSPCRWFCMIMPYPRMVEGDRMPPLLWIYFSVASRKVIAEVSHDTSL